MTTKKSGIWAIDYRPDTFENYIFSSEKTKTFIEKCISDKTIPHLFFYGPPGTGKTSLALLLKNYLEVDDMDFLKIDASKDNSVDVIRDKITQFVKMAPVSDVNYKIVFMDECDYLSPSAQAALRTITETYAHNAKFIFACNYPHKVIKEIRSRCNEIEFKTLDKMQICLRVVNILLENSVEVNDTTLDIVDEYINAHYPDFRKILVSCQAAVVDNKLVAINKGSSQQNTMTSVELIDQVSSSTTKPNWPKIRQLVSGIDENTIVETYRMFYDYLHETEKFSNVDKWKVGIVIIADHLYKHNFVAEKDINFLAMLIRLGDI